jgi:hypothetical protein
MKHEKSTMGLFEKSRFYCSADRHCTSTTTTTSTPARLFFLKVRKARQPHAPTGATQNKKEAKAVRATPQFLLINK